MAQSGDEAAGAIICEDTAEALYIQELNSFFMNGAVILAWKKRGDQKEYDLS